MMENICQLPYWQDLTDEEKHLVRDNAYIRHFEQGEILYGKCSFCLGMFRVLCGQVRAYILSSEGREITLFHLPVGDNCILSASCVLSQLSFESHLMAEQPTDVLVVPAEIFGRLCDSNVLVRCFSYELATKRFSTVMFVMQQILFYRMDKRIASFLIQKMQITGKTEIFITQEELAKQVNSAREVVARILKKFAAEELVKNKRGIITILQPDGLLRICEK